MRTFVAIWCLVTSGICYGQDTSDVKKLLDLSIRQFHASELDSGMSSAQEALRISEQLAFRVGVAISCSNIGVFYSAKGDFDHAIEHYLRSLQILSPLLSWKLSTTRLCSQYPEP